MYLLVSRDYCSDGNAQFWPNLTRSPADGEVENISASRDSLQTTRSVEFDLPATTRSVEFDNQTTRSGDSLDFTDRYARAATRYSGKISNKMLDFFKVNTIIILLKTVVFCVNVFSDCGSMTVIDCCRYCHF